MQQTESARLRQVLHGIKEEVEAGNALSAAMRAYPRVFSPLALGLIRAGEVGGVLDETLDRLACFLEKDLELRRKVKAAMTYPGLVLLAASGIVLFLVTFILPRFAELFKGMGVDHMPGPTRFLMDVSGALVGGFPLRQLVFFGAMSGVVFAWRQLIRTRAGRRFRDRVRLRLPVFGKLNHKVAVARFARTLGTLVVSGVPILQALESVAGAVDNEVIAEAILKARTAIREGESIAPPLERSGLFPPMVVHMITIGEETGALDAMLGKIADFYEAEVDTSLQSLSAALEPVMIIALGFIVGFIVIAMFLPLLAVINGIGGQDAQ